MARCRSLHEILLVRDFSPMGAVVDCLRCGDTFHISQSTLEESYFHFHHVSADGPDSDRDLFYLSSALMR